jgi:predicted DNA-binding ribbon-helix-helix protein
MKSAISKRSIVVGGHKTSVSLEDPFWAGLKEIAQHDHETLSKLVAEIDTKRRNGNLSSSLRMFVLDYFRTHEESRIPSHDGHDDGPSMWPTAVAGNQQPREDGGQVAAFVSVAAKKE